MTQVNRSALVMHTAEQMFDLVNDVRSYPHFLPWCASTEVVSESDEALVATLHLSKGGLKYSFTTRNELSRPAKMDIALVEGPFSSLHGHWVFTPLSDEASKVELTLSFEFKGKLTGLAMSKVFSSVATTLVDAFVSRAEQVYG
ncbi:MAG: type II toxin-antitoxin system RatA family toxin [Oceanospirillales bacterium]|uniref:Ribosome-associated toxin RatA of RatAB toxin-antitoxin module n=1 Tax=Marinobacterium halophilum TaxID=267374 RepID=A0A2P8ET84_9GAMM|nr:type II toxin-antitoxin system RatA family toxin [Marinobacterium halophilum]MBR9827156.1 type II toxin-antitoxin system RatA family toxin [Oceanospirillales bacterium]PSL12664.1 ribosome-associated toxin RatA of RatAB toxin-antitoxin module [Marinobacterium halophilum]